MKSCSVRSVTGRPRDVRTVTDNVTRSTAAENTGWVSWAYTGDITEIAVTSTNGRERVPRILSLDCFNFLANLGERQNPSTSGRNAGVGAWLCRSYTHAQGELLTHRATLLL